MRSWVGKGAAILLICALVATLWLSAPSPSSEDAFFLSFLSGSVFAGALSLLSSLNLCIPLIRGQVPDQQTARILFLTGLLGAPTHTFFSSKWLLHCRQEPQGLLSRLSFFSFFPFAFTSMAYAIMTFQLRDHFTEQFELIPSFALAPVAVLPGLLAFWLLDFYYNITYKTMIIAFGVHKLLPLIARAMMFKSSEAYPLLNNSCFTRSFICEFLVCVGSVLYSMRAEWNELFVFVAAACAMFYVGIAGAKLMEEVEAMLVSTSSSKKSTASYSPSKSGVEIVVETRDEKNAYPASV